MGAVLQIPWTWLDLSSSASPEASGACSDGSSPASISSKLHSMGFKTVAMALREDSRALDDPAISSEPKLAIVLGNEGNGLSETDIAEADYVVCIPMAHGVDSLNVSAAAAIAFWQLRQ